MSFYALFVTIALAGILLALDWQGSFLTTTAARRRISSDDAKPRQHDETKIDVIVSSTIGRDTNKQQPVNLLRGHPNRHLLPVQQTRRLLAQLAADDDATLERGLQYGDDAGHPDFVAALERFLQRNRLRDDFGVAAASSQDDYATPLPLFATTGVSHGIELLCSVLFMPPQQQQQPPTKDIVWVESPTYFLVGSIFRQHGLQVESLPMKDEHGTLDLDELQKRLRKGRNLPKLIYIIPSHQNPTGNTMSIEDRITLIRLAQKYHFYIVADEVYHLLDWSEESRPAGMAVLEERLASKAAKKWCISVSSFTKIFGPGIRTGWIEASPAIIQQVSGYGYIQSQVSGNNARVDLAARGGAVLGLFSHHSALQGGNGPFVNELLRIALTNGVADEVLNGLIKSYQKRAQMLVTALSVEPDIRVVHVPQGGYFVWIAFPEWLDTRELLNTCHHRVTFLPGPRCNAIPTTITTTINQNDTHHSFQNFARLCFADLDESDLVTGAQRLIEAYRAYAKNEQKNLPSLAELSEIL